MSSQLPHSQLPRESDEDNDATNQPPPSTPPNYFIFSVLPYFTNWFGEKPVDKGPNVSPVSPKIVKSFTSLGTGLFGSPTETDDRLNIFQDGMKYMAESNPSDKDRTKLNKAAVALLHNTQRTRPTFFLGDRTQYPGEQYPFARRSETPATKFPDAERVFDHLLRTSQFSEHPNGINALCIAFATVISLCLVRVNEKKPEYNETSPTLDLSPLYGVNDMESDLIRAKDGRGMLSPDCFYDDRATFLPSAVSALLVLWNRNHNYIARHLLLNNEGKRWDEPSTQSCADSTISARLLAQDDEIFKIARAINCVQFKNVIVEDFLKVLAGISGVRPGSKLDIMTDLKQFGNKGHDSTVEFSLLYSAQNWSSMASKRDIDSFQQTLNSLSEVHGVSGAFHDMSLDTFQGVIRDSTMKKNPNRRQWNVAGLRRGLDLRFKDEDLARVLQDATDDAAGAACAPGIAPCFRPIDILTIQRARNWKVEFKSFKEWNPDIEVAKAAEQLYGSIDSLELYPGLQAEATISTSGLSLGYTLTYALLVDLVTSIRSDSQFTTDLKPSTLTHWGYKHCTTAPKNGANNTWLPTLLERHLPRNYPYDNVYSLFPFTCPATSKHILGSQPDMTFDRPKVHKVQVLETRQAISHVFNDPETYPTMYAKSFEALSNGYGFVLGFDNEQLQLHDRDLIMTLFALIPDKGALSRYGEYFGKTANTLIRDHSKKNNGHISVDIVRDVINATCTRWVCQTLCGLSLEEKVVASRYEEFAALYAFIFRNVDPEHGWAIRARALESAADLSEAIKRVLPIPETQANSDLGPLHHALQTGKDYSKYFSEYLHRIFSEMSEAGKALPQHSALTFLDRLVKSNRTRAFRLGKLTEEEHLKQLTKEHLDNLVRSPGHPSNGIVLREELLEERRVIANILGLAVVISVNYAQTCAQAVDFYLDDRHIGEREEIVRLSKLSPAEARKEGANQKIMGYIREAQRLGQPLGLWRDVEKDDAIDPGHGLPSISVHKGERIFADFSKAHKDARDFPQPLKIDPDRKTPSIQGMGLHKCPGISFTMPELFKAIFRLKNLRRDGRAGRLEHIFCHPAPVRTDPRVFLESSGEMSHVPRSLSLIYDDDDGTSDSPSKPRKKNWTVRLGKETEKDRRNMDYAVSLLSLAVLLFGLLRKALIMIDTPASLLSSFFHESGTISMFWSTAVPRLQVIAVPRRPPVTEGIECPTPTTQLHGYQIMALTPGADGVRPVPIEYNLNNPKAHRLAIVAIDNRDLRMGIYVDDALRTLTTPIVRNSTDSCGESVNECLAKKFSSAWIVVPPGNHTVRIEWANNGFKSNTTEEADMELDWVKHPKRRFKWHRDICA
ncbi:hypothetical protein D9615_007704 [Tricholomella constricta]|uniref:Heme peroxidase n=1 Tax=Tricholomella constricta TaxID=117010 RepID=A0A8H5H3M7_9AGAR|nr:hypothetical protein D9615_007704 [Tricholomella constricta]